MIHGEWLAIVVEGEDHVRAFAVPQRNAGHVAFCDEHEDEYGARLHIEAVQATSVSGMGQEAGVQRR